MENALGRRIKYLREEKKLSQLEFSKILNISNSTLSQYEAGNRMPSDETKKKIAKYFNVSLDYLMGASNIRNPYKTTTNDLTEKDQREIEKILDKTRHSLEKNDGLMLQGEPVSPEAVESILEALEFGMRQAKKMNKKYTPKKYRKED